MPDLESPLLGELVTAAAAGDEGAWRDIVQSYTPLLVNVVRRYRLTPKELEDVTQTVWLRTVEHLADLREPRALPQWLITTARRECLQCLQRERRMVVLDPQEPAITARPAEIGDPADDLLRAERHQALLEGLTELPAHQRDLLMLLIEDPPLTYAEIGRRLQISVGHIGPTRARALRRLRTTASVRPFLPEPESTIETGGDRDAAALG